MTKSDKYQGKQNEARLGKGKGDQGCEVEYTTHRTHSGETFEVTFEEKPETIEKKPFQARVKQVQNP